MNWGVLTCLAFAHGARYGCKAIVSTAICPELQGGGVVFPMKDIREKNFGVIIAFWLPGFLFLWGLSYSWPLVATWLAKSNDTNAPTIGGFLCATLASLAVGLLINAVRWAVVQKVLFHGITRLHRAAINYENLKNKDVLSAFQAAVENNYRYYEYYSNAFVAIVGAFVSYLLNQKESPSLTLLTVMGVVPLILIIASRNELQKFNERAEAITK